MPIANVPSVMAYGILSHERASKLKHLSIALQPVQDRRDQKTIPFGLKLHQYANLYFHARNPMMYKRRNEVPNICVLRVSTACLGINGTVITDQNAASNYVRFLAPTQWRWLDFEAIFAADWRHPNNLPAYYRHSAQKCAECLVPGAVPPELLIGAYVANTASKHLLEATGFSLPVTIQPDLFFY